MLVSTQSRAYSSWHYVQAAFGAPIGGVLFSLEEASTYWSRKVAWRCFICTTTAVFTLAQLHPRSFPLPLRSTAEATGAIAAGAPHLLLGEVHQDT